MTKKNTYRFSFTAASLLVAEMVYLSRLVTEEGLTIDQLKPEHLNKERSATNKRQFTDLILRFKTLSGEEVRRLSHSTYDEQRLISYISFGRAYQFFRDFVEEVLVEKVTLFDMKLTEMDYNSYFSRKAVDYNEVDALADSTRKKVRQVIFRVLAEAGLIDSVKDKNIQIPHLDMSLEHLIAQSNPSDLKLLLVTTPRQQSK